MIDTKRPGGGDAVFKPLDASHDRQTPSRWAEGRGMCSFPTSRVIVLLEVTVREIHPKNEMDY